MTQYFDHYETPEIWLNLGNGGFTWIIISIEFSLAVGSVKEVWRDLRRQSLRTFDWDGSYVSNTEYVRQLELRFLRTRSRLPRGRE